MMDKFFVVVVVALFIGCGCVADDTNNVEKPSDRELKSDPCGDNVFCAYDSNVLTVSGTGAMTDYSSASSTPWHIHGKTITSIVVEQGVTSVGNNAFRDLSHVTSISLANTVTLIGAYSFCGCSGVQSLTIPESVTVIKERAFYNCTGLRSITYLGSVDPAAKEVVFSSSDTLDSVCVYLDYTPHTFCGLAVYAYTSEFSGYQKQHNQCYYVLVCGPSRGQVITGKRESAELWESQSNACRLHKCDNSTGQSFRDFCIDNNTFPNCYVTECLDNGKCLNVSLKEDKPPCIESKCTQSGWVYTEKNCTLEFIKNRRSAFNDETVDCYDISCDSNTGECVFDPRDSCGKVCNDKTCGGNLPELSCVHPTCSESMHDKVWDSECSYDGIYYQQNECYELVCKVSGPDILKKSSAESWESYTSDWCTDYKCDNKTGNKLNGKCYSKTGSGSICVNDQCMDKATASSNKWTVTIDLGNVNVTQLDKSNLTEALSRLTGIPEENITVGAEVDGDGGVNRIYVFVDDEESALNVSSTVDECLQGDPDNSNPDCDTVQGLVGRSPRIAVIIPGALYLSDAVSLHQKVVSVFVAFIMAFVTGF